MSRRRAIYLVARRELLERGRSRAFLFSLLLSVAIVLGGIFLPALIGGGRGTSHLGVVGQAPPGLTEALEGTATALGQKVSIDQVGDLATGEKRVRDGPWTRSW